MKSVTIKDLLDAGIHFGHKTKRWNPKMSPFIFGERNGIHIIDLQQTVVCFSRAIDKIKEFESDYIQFLHSKHQDVLDQLAAGILTEEITSVLEKSVLEVALKYVKKDG